MTTNITGFEDKFCPNNFDKAESIRKGLASGLGEFIDKYYKLCNIYKKLEDANTSNYTSNNTVQGDSTSIPTDNQYENWSE